MQLTEHFSLAEFQRSATASKLGIDNTIPEALIPSIKNLCVNVLEPLREHVCEPVIISSGYRCPALNKAVGGVSNSQHMKGEAADIRCPTDANGNPDKQKLHDWFLWLMDCTNVDQLLYERSGSSQSSGASGSTTWIHVSCKPDVSKNRHQVKRINKPLEFCFDAKEEDR